MKNISLALVFYVSLAKNRGYCDFPGGPGVKILLSSAGDASSISSQGTKIPHAACNHSKKSPRAATKTQCSQKLKKKKNRGYSSLSSEAKSALVEYCALEKFWKNAHFYRRAHLWLLCEDFHINHL